MKIHSLLSIGKSLAIAILALGIIHDMATFTPLIKSGLNRLDAENLNAVTYFSLMCGTSLIVSGIILLQLLKKVDQYPFLKPTLLCIGGFLALNGILSVVCMFNNPFAWIVLFLNLSMFALIIKLKTGSSR
jgi:hypothetical protein